MTTSKDVETFYPESRTAWRLWLTQHHQVKDAVQLLLYKKESGKPTISWSDAVEEALCFGWIDSKRKPIDKDHFMQFFSKRKPKSTWSKINKDKIKLLTKQGLMSEAGLACIKKAKQNGSWTILDEVEKLIVPDDLQEAFAAKPKAKNYYDSLSPSVRKAILLWLVLAQKTETRAKRIAEIVNRAAQKQKPQHLQ